MARGTAATTGDRLAGTGQSTAAGRIEGEAAICPLCGVATPDARDLYVHLQTGHRKSTLAGMVLRR